ncbi:lysophospholipid acyltransferase family protein [Candidatus Endomicrobiellum devescovinae]|jgi:KDO2-lipid IV(A) lauroyltransferase|uniref:lysophospholipid acyltransferase family protein n=1 Tax=Candidatus Endomicrobiellum devescovinae TaxID=3242322 RepID=UPI00281B30F9|nr:lysophospholipid acyltransferase family protein [Endomicrobium sp.]
MLDFKKVRRRIYYYGAYVFSKLVLILPYKFSVGFLSSFFGRIAYYVAIDGARSARRNLKKCFPEKSNEDIKRMVKKIFSLEARNFFELANFPRMNSKFMRSIAFVEKLDHIQESLKNGKGILFASAHTGNWEITAAIMAEMGIPVNVVAKKIYIDGLNDMLVEYRKNKNIKVILREAPDSGIKLLRALKRGETIAMLIDQDVDVAGVFVNFFGQKAWTPSGLAVLALKTEADVYVAFDQRIDEYKHKTVVNGPISFTKTDDFEKDVEKLTQDITSILEEHIKRYPEQWVWFHDRWKTKPEEVKDRA